MSGSNGPRRVSARSHLLTLPLSHVLTFSPSHFPTFSPSHIPPSHVPTFSRYRVPIFSLSHFLTFSPSAGRSIFPRPSDAISFREHSSFVAASLTCTAALLLVSQRPSLVPPCTAASLTGPGASFAHPAMRPTRSAGPRSDRGARPSRPGSSQTLCPRSARRPRRRRWRRAIIPSASP